jgi:5'-nucleotidase
VLLGILHILDRAPDLVVSGINSGPNLGDDVTYSGTVAGAIEGTLLGVPSMAVSVAEPGDVRFEPAAEYTRRLVREVLGRGMPVDTFLNVNVPNRSLERIKGVKVTRLGRHLYRTPVVENVDPRGRPYYWIGAQDPSWSGGEDTDFAAIAKGYVSVSPLHLDMTQYGAMEELKRWELGAVDRERDRTSRTRSEGSGYDADRDAPDQ